MRERLLQYTRGDNRITELTRAYRIELGTGWYTPPGVVHAPGVDYVLSLMDCSPRTRACQPRYGN